MGDRVRVRAGRRGEVVDAALDGSGCFVRFDGRVLMSWVYASEVVEVTPAGVGERR